MSASCGSVATRRERRSRTSLAASSMSRSSANWIVMRESSSALEDVSFSMPSMPATASSMGCVMRDSTTGAEAPRYVVCTVTDGRSVRGISRTPRRDRLSKPTNTSSRHSTVANTGRRMDSSESVTCWFPRCPRRALLRRPACRRAASARHRSLFVRRESGRRGSAPVRGCGVRLRLRVAPLCHPRP